MQTASPALLMKCSWPCSIIFWDDAAVDLKSLLFMDDHKVYAAKPVRKVSLKIFPFGMVQKITAEQLKKAKVVVTNLKDKSYYQVQQPKLDLKKGTGAIAPFFWVAETNDTVWPM